MAKEFRVPDCQELHFSTELSQKRLSQARRTLGPGVVQRLLGFALYLLGLKRSAIGQAINMPTETVKSMIKTISRDGVPGLEDRRRVSSQQESQKPKPITLRHEGSFLVIDLGGDKRDLKLSREDSLQLKTVLISMANSGILPKREAAQALNVSSSYMTILARRFQEQGTTALLDKRQGQKQDYRVPPAVKGELIQQFAVDLISCGRTSSARISAELKERCGLEVSARTVRHHMALMGLKSVKRSLPQLVAAVKKTSTTCSSS